jgi:hypothetical protein
MINEPNRIAKLADLSEPKAQGGGEQTSDFPGIAAELPVSRID